LDGQECRLDAKYSRVLKKKRNIPIVMIANKLPAAMKEHGPFRARFYRLLFKTNIDKLEEERIVATLWGCIQRRIMQSPLTWMQPTPKNITLNYNEDE